jgi:cytochrome c biogenesis protein CcdA
MISAIWFAARLALGQDTADLPRPVVRSAIVGAPAARAGDTVWLGLRLTAEKGWHTYWRNPGAAGAPPEAHWSHELSIDVGPLTWPAPRRFVSNSLTSYGYDDTIVLPFRLRLNEHAHAGDRLALSGTVEWVACRIECVSGTDSVAFTVRVVQRGVDLDAAAIPEIDRALGDLPHPLQGWTAVFTAGAPAEISLRWPSAFLFDSLQVLPEDRGRVDDSRSLDARIIEPGHAVVGVPTSAYAPKPPEQLRLVVIGYSGGVRQRPISVVASRSSTASATSLLVACAFALLGGLLLNAMPCVFPVLGLKVTALIDGGSTPSRVVAASAYFVGVLASCLAGAAFLALLPSTDGSGVWGAQLQSPIVVLASAALLVLSAAWLLELVPVPRLPALLTRVAGRRKAGMLGWFLTGIFTTTVGAPCTAPFIGASAAASLAMPVWALVAFWSAFAAGIALPVLVLSAIPGLFARLPRSGSWMTTLRRVCAVPTLAAAVWLVFVARAQLGQRSSTGGGWAAFSPDRFTAAQLAGSPVFVDFTADWCLTCLVNERRVLSRADIDSAFTAAGFVRLKADLTRNNPVAARALASVGRASLPAYAVFPDDAGPPELLPLVLDRSIVLDAVRRAHLAARRLHQTPGRSP